MLTRLPQSTANNSGYNINTYECVAPSVENKKITTTHLGNAQIKLSLRPVKQLHGEEEGWG